MSSWAHFAALAHHQGVSESAFLRRLVDASLVPATVVNPQSPDIVEPVSETGRLSIRLRSDDLLLLRERARAREMPTSTYVSLLIRSHLRALTPLPTVELVALKRSVAEIGAIGRNLNQVARAVNQGERPNGPSKADLQAQRAGSTHLRDRQQRIIGEWSAGTLKWGDGEVKLAKTRQEVVEGWRGVSARLKTDGDLELGESIDSFLAQMPPAKTEKRLLIERSRTPTLTR